MDTIIRLVQNMGEKMLTVAQLATPESHWKACRAKMLRIINDAVRELENGNIED